MELKTFKRNSFIFIGISALVSFPLLVFMVFGIPGIDDGSDRVKGFTLCFQAIGLYFFVSFVTFIVYALINFISRKLDLTEHIGTGIIGLFWLFFCFSLFNFIRGVTLMI